MNPLRLTLALGVSAILVLGLSASVQAAENDHGVDLKAAAALTISHVAANNIGYYGATIVSRTNAPAISQVFYDTVSRQQIEEYRYSSDESATPVTDHSVRLTGLAAGTTYYYRVRAEVTGTDFLAISDEYTFTTQRTAAPPGPGPGPGPSPPRPPQKELQISVEGEATKHAMTDEGELLKRIERTSSDGKTTIVIPEGTMAQDKDGNPLSTLMVDINPNPPPPPEDAHIIGLAYEFGPPGAAFSPPLTLTWQYDPADIPEGMSQDDLVVAYYNAATGQWVELPSVVDARTNTITVKVSHFTTFAIIAVPTVVPPDRYDLAIQSTAGGSVTTPGEGTFAYDEGTVVTLLATPEEGYRFQGWSGDVDAVADVDAIQTTITVEGDYSVTANFKAVRPFAWWWIVIGVAIVGLVVFMVLRRRSRTAEGNKP